MSRLVVVLGRDPVIDIDAVIKVAWRENVELVILTLGWIPLSSSQQRVCDSALEAAGRGLIALEEKIVYDPANAASMIRDDDRVRLAVDALEKKRLDSAFAKGFTEPRDQLG